MIWLGVEPLVAENPGARARARRQRQHPARRAVHRAPRGRCRRARAARRRDRQAPPKMHASLLEGMRDGLEGRVDLRASGQLGADVRTAEAIAGRRVARLAVEVARAVRRHRGGARGTSTAVRTAASPIEDRRRALQTLAAQRRPELVPELPAAAGRPGAPRRRHPRHRGVRRRRRSASCSLARYPTFSSAEKAEAIQTLASRGRYGRMLTEALATDVDPEARRAAPRRAAAAPGGRRQVRRRVGTGRGGRRRGTGLRPLPRAAQRQRRWRAPTPPTDGRSFSAPAAPCHKMYGEGGAIGPDITGSNRANLEYLLFNVLNPNAEVQDAYKMVVVTTRDGRTLSGNVIAETDRQITLRVVGRRSRGDQQGRHPVARVDGDVDDAAGPLRRADRSRGDRSRRRTCGRSSK